MSDAERSREVAGSTWTSLRRYTQARIALGRVGASMPTRETLAFGMAHAQARDAVRIPLDVHALETKLLDAGFSTLRAWSRAANRAEYLRRPDLGRELAPECAGTLACDAEPHRLTIVVADGLSALAAMRHATPLLSALRDRLTHWTLDVIVIATGSRVALGDAIGELRRAEAVAVLVGERPGLSAIDSLGVYLTYAPRPGRSDAERNCVSNVRPGGLGYDEAAFRLHYLLEASRRKGQSGIGIKDASAWFMEPAQTDSTLKKKEIVTKDLGSE